LEGLIAGGIGRTSLIERRDGEGQRRGVGANKRRGAASVAGAVQKSESLKISAGLDEVGEDTEARGRRRGLDQRRREVTQVIFREEADNVANVDHETRVLQNVVLGGPA